MSLVVPDFALRRGDASVALCLAPGLAAAVVRDVLDRRVKPGERITEMALASELKVARGFQEFIDAGLLSGELPAFNGAQALELLAQPARLALRQEAGNAFARVARTAWNCRLGVMSPHRRTSAVLFPLRPRLAPPPST